MGYPSGKMNCRVRTNCQFERRITADTALRLAKYFKMSPQFWLGLQMDYDLDVADDQIGDRLDHEIREYRPTA